MNVKKSPIDFVTSNKRQILGWTAVGLSTAFTCFWSMWGILENFHEGWYYESLLTNLGMMFRQYLSIPIVVMALSLIALKWPRVGIGLLIPGPIVALGLLYLFGRPKPKKGCATVAHWLAIARNNHFGNSDVYQGCNPSE